MDGLDWFIVIISVIIAVITSIWLESLKDVTLADFINKENIK